MSNEIFSDDQRRKGVMGDGLPLGLEFQGAANNQNRLLDHRPLFKDLDETPKVRENGEPYIVKEFSIYPAIETTLIIDELAKTDNDGKGVVFKLGLSDGCRIRAGKIHIGNVRGLFVTNSTLVKESEAALTFTELVERKSNGYDGFVKFLSDSFDSAGVECSSSYYVPFDKPYGLRARGPKDNLLLPVGVAPKYAIIGVKVAWEVVDHDMGM